MRERVPLLLALAVGVVLAVGVGLRSRKTPSPSPSSSAEAAIGRALSAAVAGDVDGYLRCFTEPLRSQLERAVAETGRDAYSASLRQRGGSMTGWAVTLLPDAAPDDVRMRVEVVFRDRNEVQDYILRKVGASWCIVDLGQATTARMPIAYGTPVGSEAAPSVSAGERSTP